MGGVWSLKVVTHLLQSIDKDVDIAGDAGHGFFGHGLCLIGAVCPNPIVERYHLRPHRHGLAVQVACEPASGHSGTLAQPRATRHKSVWQQLVAPAGFGPSPALP